MKGSSNLTGSWTSTPYLVLTPGRTQIPDLTPDIGGPLLRRLAVSIGYDTWHGYMVSHHPRSTLSVFSLYQQL